MVEFIILAIVCLVGYVVYLERAITLPVIATAWLGFITIWAPLGGGFPIKGPGIVWICLGLSVAAIVVLWRRFPLFGFFMACLITSLMTGGRVWGAPYYFGRRRRW